jgi:Abortive infection C-terminus
MGVCAEHLNLAPNQHTEVAFKSVLGGCQIVVQYLATIRNRLGDAHGTGRAPVRPAHRHAALVINLAGTVAAFLVETYHARK